MLQCATVTDVPFSPNFSPHLNTAQKGLTVWAVLTKSLNPKTDSYCFYKMSFLKSRFLLLVTEGTSPQAMIQKPENRVAKMQNRYNLKKNGLLQRKATPPGSRGRKKGSRCVIQFVLILFYLYVHDILNHKNL